MKRRSAFTLVELVMVIVIIGLLSAIIIPQFTNTRSLAEEGSAKETLVNLSKTFEMFYLKHGRYPTSMSELMPPAGNQLSSDPCSIQIGIFQIDCGVLNPLGYGFCAREGSTMNSFAIFTGGIKMRYVESTGWEDW